MSIELARRIKVLEGKVAELEKMPEAFRQIMDSYLLSSKPMDKEKVAANVAAIAGRGMCPKCGVKPNHFFHVKNCAGQKEEQKNGDDGIRTSGTT